MKDGAAARKNGSQPCEATLRQVMPGQRKCNRQAALVMVPGISVFQKFGGFKPEASRNVRQDSSFEIEFLPLPAQEQTSISSQAGSASPPAATSGPLADFRQVLDRKTLQPALAG
jgi:hypothetical protein